MAEPTKPNVVYHADWGSKAEKRWCARAALSADDRYTAFASETVGNLGSLIERLRTEAGPTGCAFAGFDFPIGVPASYAKRAGISSFPDFLLKLGHDEWNGFDSVCDEAEQILARRPFYPLRQNDAYDEAARLGLFYEENLSGRPKARIVAPKPSTGRHNRDNCPL